GGNIPAHLRLMFNHQDLFHSSFKNGKSDCHGRALANFAVHLHFSGVEVGAAFDEEQAESGARAGPDVAAAMKGFEQALLVLLRNANAAVTNDADRVAPAALHG